ncbi:hypothetical protein CEXT_234271 [Caerostris extrusa]|uniref:Uncharacterized protein n=1 Tax=Caerostris extrusa TaxID=172846 RepID=A0AAV4QYS3_CAEEX|nr:hypothetical protein CEXT_234271 [Caerostris extrusa]
MNSREKGIATLNSKGSFNVLPLHVSLLVGDELRDSCASSPKWKLYKVTSQKLRCSFERIISVSLLSLVNREPPRSFHPYEFGQTLQNAVGPSQRSESCQRNIEGGHRPHFTSEEPRGSYMMHVGRRYYLLLSRLID